MSVGDILVRCGRTYEFAIITNITKTGRIRIEMVSKNETVGGVVYPTGEKTGESKVLTSKRTYGKGSIEEYWDEYDDTREYKE